MRESGEERDKLKVTTIEKERARENKRESRIRETERQSGRYKEREVDKKCKIEC